jgi:hypothetical protein
MAVIRKKSEGDCVFKAGLQKKKCVGLSTLPH